MTSNIKEIIVAFKCIERQFKFAKYESAGNMFVVIAIPEIANAIMLIPKRKIQRVFKALTQLYLPLNKFL
jgi:hypothetical protein